MSNGNSGGGWNRPTSNQPTAKKGGTKSPSLMKGVIVGAVAVVVGVVCIFAFSGKSEKPVEDTGTKPAKIKEVTPAPAPKAVEEAPKEDPNAAAKKARAEKLKKMTPDQRWEFMVAEAKKRPIDLTPSTNRTFRSGTEQVMSWVFTTRLGDMPPPMPVRSIVDEAHLADIIIADNKILDTDTEKQREAKEIVTEAKKELREYIKQGGDIDKFLEYYRGQLVQAHNEWQESQKSVMQVIREDPDLASSYIAEVNDRLAKKGIKPVRISPKIAEKLGLDVETK